ncbi:hypothetical protein ACFQV2_11470 [Actinokineospora soli]|uniref:Uncharacterized protein n=1 Tax=Actinokineospora soli TaxID=1048753 RepID=A0ABW2TK01_9PSEU
MTALLIGGFPVLELWLDEDLRHSEFPIPSDTTWAQIALALGAGCLVAVGLDLWRGRSGLERAHPAWRTTFGLTGAALVGSSGVFLLLLTPPPPSEDVPGLSGGSFGHFQVIRNGPIELPVDLRWAVVPLAVGVALLVSAAVARRDG